MRIAAAVALALAACSSPPGAAPSAPASEGSFDCGDRPCREVARDHQLGRGVTRSYSAAARYLAKGCEDNDPVACRELGYEILRSRGVAYDRTRSDELYGAACRGGDTTSCAYLARTDPAESPETIRLDEACAAGDLDACTFAYLAAAEEVLAACEPSPQLCETLIAKEDEAVQRAYRALEAMCAEGDADICAFLPGRAIDLDELCRADDYGACWEQVVQGQVPRAAARRPCELGAIAPACAWLAEDLRDGEEDRGEEARAMFKRACDLGDHGRCWDALTTDTLNGCTATGVERVKPADRTALAKVRSKGRDGATQTLPNGTPLLLLAAGMIGDDAQRLAASRLAGLERGFEVVVLVESFADAPPGTDDVTVLEVPDVAAVIGAHARLIDAAGQTRATFAIGLDRVPGSFGRCLAALLAEP